MTISELSSRVRFITDPSGSRQAVVLDLAVWEEILSALDEAGWDESFANSQDALAKLADEALLDYAQGKTQILDPEKL
jgi:hypothetical protein